MKEERKSGILDNALIWFGAAVSIAEILTGTLLAPLGFARGIAAVVLGHLIGFCLMYLAGLMGARTGLSSMETVKLSFGQKGALLFSGLNVLQLLGWTAIMIINGAAAASSIFQLGGQWVWYLVIGGLIILWVLAGVESMGRLGTAAMAALFLLTVVLSFVIFGGDEGHTADLGEAMSFGAAVELSVAMPLSWLPLVADYTRHAKAKTGASLAGAGVYFVVSCWMYIIGMGAALFTGESDIAAIMLKAGLGIAGLITVVLSTVTTTFLDVFSAGVSSVTLWTKLKEKPMAVAVGVVGTLLAIFAPMTRYESFLYLIGSVFAPMAAVMFTDMFILKKDSSGKAVSVQNLLIWAAGFAVYRLFMGIDIPLGSTLPAMAVTAMLCIVVNKITDKNGGNKNAG